MRRRLAQQQQLYTTFLGHNTGVRQPHVILKRHPPAKKHIKSYQVFRAWLKDYHPPFLFFIELSILLLFCLLAFAMQQTTLPFFQDFGKAVDNYFMRNYSIATDEQDDSFGMRRIYTKKDFFHVLNSTIDRYFLFDEQFPCSYQMDQITNLSIVIATPEGDIRGVFHNNENGTACEFVQENLVDFTSVTLHMLFEIRQTSGEKLVQVLRAGFTSSFVNYEETGIILWSNIQERSVMKHKSGPDDYIYTLTFSVSLLIVVLLGAGVIMQSLSLWSLSWYSALKARREQISTSVMFRHKLDLWEPVTLVFNLVSMTLMIISLIWGQDVNEKLPWPHFLLALASFIHAFLIFRYLVLRPSTLIVVRMIMGASITLLQFVVGCTPWFVGYLIFGVCWFGWYSPLMSSSRQAAKFMISSSYGDYLLDGYDDICDGGDKPAIIPSSFETVWIFNGMGVWFYVVLAILHAALIKEVHKARDERIEKNQQDLDEDPLPWLQFLPM